MGMNVCGYCGSRDMCHCKTYWPCTGGLTPSERERRASDWRDADAKSSYYRSGSNGDGSRSGWTLQANGTTEPLAATTKTRFVEIDERVYTVNTPEEMHGVRRVLTGYRYVMTKIYECDGSNYEKRTATGAWLYNSYEK